MQLTQQQRDQYDRDGILVFPELFSEAEVAILRREVTRLKGVEDECIFREGESNTPKIVFKMDDPKETPRDGAIVVDTKIRGYVAIARYSFTLDQSVGMALVDAPLAVEGTPLRIYEDGCQGAVKLARVVPMPFYDPGGERMRL